MRHTLIEIYYVKSLPKLISFQLGLQIPRGVCSQISQKKIYGKIREKLGEIFHELARQKECQIVEGHLLIDHVHMCIAIPPKHAVSAIIGFLKGKSAIVIARMSGKERNFNGENFWAWGYAVSTVGFDLPSILKYIRSQEDNDKQNSKF